MKKHSNIAVWKEKKEKKSFFLFTAMLELYMA